MWWTDLNYKTPIQSFPAFVVWRTISAHANVDEFLDTTDIFDVDELAVVVSDVEEMSSHNEWITWWNELSLSQWGNELKQWALTLQTSTDCKWLMPHALMNDPPAPASRLCPPSPPLPPPDLSVKWTTWIDLCVGRDIRFSLQIGSDWPTIGTNMGLKISLLFIPKWTENES